MKINRIYCASIAFLALVMFGNFVSYAGAVSWESAVQLAPSALYSGFAAEGTTLHAARGDGAIVYRRSTNEGVTWSSEVQIAQGYLYPENPTAVSGNTVYIVYFSNIRTVSDWYGSRAMGDVFAVTSTNGGASWQQPVQITTAQAGLRVSVGVSAQGANIVWMDYRSGKWDLYTSRTVNAGTLGVAIHC